MTTPNNALPQGSAPAQEGALPTGSAPQITPPEGNGPVPAQPGPQAPACQMESPGRGAKGPRPGFQGAVRPRRPPRAAGILPTPTGQGRPMECNLNQAGSNAPAIEQVGIYDRRQGGNGDGRV